eukprot:9274743-Ditylum_brightwellii.AAC.2
MRHANFHYANAAHYALCYLQGCKQHGTCFSTSATTDLSEYVNFSISSSTLTAMADANLGPQDASAPKDTPPPQFP